MTLKEIWRVACADFIPFQADYSFTDIWFGVIWAFHNHNISSERKKPETKTNRRTLSINYLAEYIYINVYTSKIFTYFFCWTFLCIIFFFQFFFQFYSQCLFACRFFLIYTWRHYLLLRSFIKHLRIHFNWFGVLKYYCSNVILPVKLQTSEFVRPYVTYVSWL